MKRNPVTVVAGLVAALSLALAGCAGTPAAAPASTPAAGGSTAQAPADAKTYKVGVSQYVAHPSLDASLVGFKKALADAGLEVTYDEKNGNADQATVTSISTTFATAGLDLVLAIATPSAQAAARRTVEKGARAHPPQAGGFALLQAVDGRSHAPSPATACANRRRRSGRRSSGKTSQYCSAFSSANTTPA